MDTIFVKYTTLSSLSSPTPSTDQKSHYTSSLTITSYTRIRSRLQHTRGVVYRNKLVDAFWVTIHVPPLIINHWFTSPMCNVVNLCHHNHHHAIRYASYQHQHHHRHHQHHIIATAIIPSARYLAAIISPLYIKHHHRHHYDEPCV